MGPAPRHSYNSRVIRIAVQLAHSTEMVVHVHSYFQRHDATTNKLDAPMFRINLFVQSA